ncbi:MAG: Hpt domain-containing protein [Shimia sp.]|uniref:Hpt domain-containing protein n=1 Tax=Shimia sp. TaxID=1954381 RepID=UPI0040585C38
MSDLRDMFFEECDDLMEVLSTGLDDLQNGNGDAETINAMFRSVHSIKGGGGAFGLDQLINFAHAFENVLEDLRSERIDADAGLIALMFSAFDHLSDLLTAARDGNVLPDTAGASILSDLQQVSPPAGGDASGEAEVASLDFVPLTLDIGGDDLDTLPVLDFDLDAAAPASGGTDAYIIEFSADPGLYARGHDPALLFRALADLGDVTTTADTADVLPLADCGESLAALTWVLHLVPNDGIDEDDIREVFEFVESQCMLDITTGTMPDDQDTDLPDLGEAPALPSLDGELAGAADAPIASAPAAQPAEVASVSDVSTYWSK